MSNLSLLNSFHSVVVSPLVERVSEKCCSAKSLGTKVYRIASTAFSGIGNWPFYGVAASFGNQYSPILGKILGGSEFASYFAFRISNFEEIRQKIFGGDSNTGSFSVKQSRSPSNAVVEDFDESKDPIHSKPLLKSENNEVPPPGCSSRWKTIAKNTGIAALGIIAQFPIMVLAYYGNGENLAYPLICGACEASFTILSLLLTFQSSKKNTENFETDSKLIEKRNTLIAHINCFLEELPEKYKNPDFSKKVDSIFSRDDSKSDEERGKELLALIAEARGLPPVQKGAWNGALTNLAKGIGILIAGYLTTVNGAVSYKAVKAWKSDQDILALATTVLVGLANIKLLTKLCMDSAQDYYEGIRDVIKGQYRPPLAYSVSPIGWGVGRAFSTIGSWLSFGTTATAARDYIPQVGNAFIGPAPLSSALLLNQNLNSTADHFLLSLKSKWDSKTKQFAHLNDSITKFKQEVESADEAALDHIFRQVEDLGKPVVPIQSEYNPLLSKV
jgi:hypothetical protein